MNFRSLSYFLTVCEMGTINSAARKLYISQQSLSQHIKKLEDELQAQLFHRDTPLVLTEEGKVVQRTAQDILALVDGMHVELARMQRKQTTELTIGALDYGIPDFLPPLMDIFLQEEKSIVLSTREIRAEEPIPKDISLFFSSRELGAGYKSEILFTAQLVVCVSDVLLKITYGVDWQHYKTRLLHGDFSALKCCPFLQQRNTPLQGLMEMAFVQNHFTPRYFPVIGSPATLTQFCAEGKAAMVTFKGPASTINVPIYPIPNVEKEIPAGYISYPADVVLPAPAQKFLDITNRYFQKYRANQPKA